MLAYRTCSFYATILLLETCWNVLRDVGNPKSDSAYLLRFLLLMPQDQSSLFMTGSQWSEGNKAESDRWLKLWRRGHCSGIHVKDNEAMDSEWREPFDFYRAMEKFLQKSKVNIPPVPPALQPTLFPPAGEGLVGVYKFLPIFRRTSLTMLICCSSSFRQIKRSFQIQWWYSLLIPETATFSLEDWQCSYGIVHRNILPDHCIPCSSSKGFVEWAPFQDRHPKSTASNIIAILHYAVIDGNALHIE